MTARSTIATSVAALALLGMTACQTDRPTVNPEFDRADANKDGKVSVEEFAQYVNKGMFKRLDKNGNGSISFEEWKSFDTAPEARQHFDVLDPDKNGRIELAEYLKAAGNHSNLRETFADLDRNNDKFLSHEEFSAFDGLKIWAVHF